MVAPRRRRHGRRTGAERKFVTGTMATSVSDRRATGSVGAGDAPSSSGGASLGLAAPGSALSSGALDSATATADPGGASVATGPVAPGPRPDTPERIPPPKPRPRISTSATTPSAAMAGVREPPAPDRPGAAAGGTRGHGVGTAARVRLARVVLRVADAHGAELYADVKRASSGEGRSAADGAPGPCAPGLTCAPGS